MESRIKIMILILLILPSSLFANEWFDFADLILSERNEPQISFWINFVKENTKTHEYIYSVYGERVYDLKNGIKIRECFSNDDGSASKGNIAGHGYIIEFPENKSVLLIIKKESLYLRMDYLDKLVFTIDHRVKKTKYFYTEDLFFSTSNFDGN